jgi:opacity protein-like surface antigen
MRPALAILSLLLASPALADGDATQPALVPAPAPAAAPSWTGFYVGVQYEGHPTLDESQDGFGFVSDYGGTLVGAFGGYRHDFGRVVLGAELDYVRGAFERDKVAPFVFVLPGFDNPFVNLFRFGGEVGVDLGNVLVYAAAGTANIEINYGGVFGLYESTGSFYGLGIDYRINDHLVFGVEYLQNEFSDFDSPIAIYDVSSIAMNVAVTF